MSKDLPVKKIYIDNKFRRGDSVSSSNFKIDLPQTLKLPDNAIFYVDDVCIPHNWYTVETGVNDKLYFRLQLANGGTFYDYTITLDSKNYNGVQFAAEVGSKVQGITGGAATSTSYDAQTKQMSVSVANMDINFFTDAELKDLTSWSGSYYNPKDKSCGNELLTNIFPNVVGNTANPAKYYLNLQPVRNIYMRSPNISSFSTIGCNGESSIIKKIPVSSNNGDMIFNNITSANDFLDCSRATWKTLEFHLVDVNSKYVNLHGANVSFSLILDKQIPDQ